MSDGVSIALTIILLGALTVVSCANVRWHALAATVSLLTFL